MYDKFLNIYEEYEIRKIKTGIPRLDFSINGGFEEGSLIDFRGKSGSGKSLIALSVIKNNIDKNIIYVNANGKYNGDFLKKAKIDASKIKVINTNRAEDVFNILFRIIPEKLAEIIIIDDIASLKSKFNDKELVAEILNGYMHDLLWCLSKHKSMAIFINQNRNIMGNEVYIAQNILNKRAKYIFKFSKVSLLRYENNYIGQGINIEVLKPSVKSSNVKLRTFYNYGIDYSIEMIEFGLQEGVLKKRGNWIFFEDINLGNGIYTASIRISRSPKLFDEIKESLDEFMVNNNG